MKLGVVVLALVGLVAAVVVVAFVGLGQVAASVAAIGLLGFAVFCLASLAVIPVLGLAWWGVVPRRRAPRWPVFAWSRLLRDAAADVLPFSQVGGLVVGARELSARGLDPSLTFAATILDLTTELAAQLVYTLFGVAALFWVVTRTAHDTPAAWIAGVGLIIAASSAGGFLLAQRRGLQALDFLAGRWFPEAIARAEAVQRETLALYARRGALASSAGLHLVAWIGSGACAWLALHLMGARIGLVAVLAIESLLYAVKSFAFVVPNAVGVQEGAYALIGPVFGLPAETALALSLIKRARDLVLGAPVLLIWQALEGGRLFRRRAARLA